MKYKKIVPVLTYEEAGIENKDFRHMCMPLECCNEVMQFLFAQVVAIDITIRATVSKGYNEVDNAYNLEDIVRRRNMLVNFYLHMYAALHDEPCNSIHLIKIEDYETA